MRSARNALFIGLVILGVVSWRASVEAGVPCAFYWCQYMYEAPTEANGCTFQIENVTSLWQQEETNPCPTVAYSGSCDFAVGCQDGQSGAEDVCGWWEDVTEEPYYVAGYECVEPLDPPTEFSFSCQPIYFCVPS